MCGDLVKYLLPNYSQKHKSFLGFLQALRSDLRFERIFPCYVSTPSHSMTMSPDDSSSGRQPLQSRLSVATMLYRCLLRGQ